MICLRKSFEAIAIQWAIARPNGPAWPHLALVSELMMAPPVQHTTRPPRHNMRMRTYYIVVFPVRVYANVYMGRLLVIATNNMIFGQNIRQGHLPLISNTFKTHFTNGHQFTNLNVSKVVVLFDKSNVKISCLHKSFSAECDRVKNTLGLKCPIFEAKVASCQIFSFFLVGVSEELQSSICICICYWPVPVEGVSCYYRELNWSQPAQQLSLQSSSPRGELTF